MGTIRVLDDQLANRIAAGEVVERPASVVKELVENALDARATRIDIVLEDGGRRRIVVADDGIGMDRDDALLALERHATSKLRRFEDLDAIATLGFRGEALPSIASVSRMLLRTAAVDGEGTEIEVRGGRIASVDGHARARGTTIEIGGLFFNVPARRKFLRAAATELAHAARIVGQLALAHPQVRFRLEHGGRAVLDAPSASSLDERAAQVLGRERTASFVPFETRPGMLRVFGLAGRPVDATPRRDTQYFFVNGRPVADRTLAHAVTSAFGQTVARGLHPAAVLFVEVEPSRVDVNVHPQKTEVRFARASEIHDAVRDAVVSALAKEGVVPTYAELRTSSSAVGSVAVLEPPRVWSAPPAAERSFLDDDGPAAEPGRVAVPLAQYRDSYIVAQDAQGLVLVDQHVAHERVLYERYLDDAERGEVAVQRLLFPKTIDLTPEEAAILEGESPELVRLGFPHEPFGDRAVKLDGVPAFAKDVAPERLFRSLIGEAARTKTAATGDPDLRRRLVTSAACQAAIKVNYPLTREGMQRLLDDLFKTQNPTTCPHGRPILFRLTLEEIERAFRRR
ncbi:MAG TPA: DNA mismatch repair endonuclease MutL [Candidatus Polarisedimenticolaceae bacterium]|nr:DNA mismatch repair endonuclease MutL [Candidatus Polarisedimenticolaceae bacterium]